jgi:hypothetical protein
MPMINFCILVVIVMVASVVFIQLAGMPGVTAHRRGHPQAKAIQMLGWIGLPLGVLPWLIALIWSNLDPLNITTDLEPANQSSTEPDDDDTAAAS